ncbi:MAG: VCBS repeat-containing protein [Myxococcaceae bacterium]|nr:VCBS repeat-containing protein [Myxococcaceae bacterium]
MESRPGYFHADLTGDGRLDMVIFSLCEDPTIGSTRWLGYPTNANGYGPPVYVSLPAGFGTYAFQRAPGGTPLCGAPNSPAYLVLDMTGDGLSDLLLYSQCNVSGWRLYPGSASGFGAPITWGLPSDGSLLNFSAGLAETGEYCGSNQLIIYRYSAADMNGDGRIDLVATRACTDMTVGTTKWFVYLNTGSGFAAPVPWTLPAGFSTNAFSWFGSGGITCSGGQDVPAFGVFDLDGDRRSDLVLFDTCDNSAGVQSWRVYPGTGAGFGMPYSKSWPAGYLDGAFARGYGGPLSCVSGPGFPNYSLFDFDGVGGLDLIVTDTCQDATVGTSRWLVHRSARMGFAAAQDVALPADAGVMTSLSAPIQSCPGGWPHLLFDFTGDGRPDVVHNDSCSDSSIGRTRWLLYENGCVP